SLWDDEICASVRGAEWLLSARPADVDELKLAAGVVASAPGLRAGRVGAGAALDEPLVAAARLARMVAPVLCHRSPASDCSWYHGLWPYLRLFGLGASPDRHARFYRDALGQLAAS